MRAVPGYSSRTISVGEKVLLRTLGKGTAATTMTGNNCNFEIYTRLNLHAVYIPIQMNAW